MPCTSAGVHLEIVKPGGSLDGRENGRAIIIINFVAEDGYLLAEIFNCIPK